jgi:hypothetical protein
MSAIEQQAMTPAVGAHVSESPADFSGRRAFRLLHDTGCFVIPNPWDAPHVKPSMSHAPTCC